MKVDQEHVDTAQSLMDFYQPRNDLFAHMEDMYYSRWDFPSGMPDWVIKQVSTDPHDAVLTTTRTFATSLPTFRIMPMLPNEANRERANQIETAISYNWKQASRRKPTSITWDILWSASLYAQVAAQVVYLPYQEKVLKAMGKDTKRIKSTRRFGDFAFIIHNPANIYPSFSEYGLEYVLAVRVQAVDEFMATWGELGKKLVPNNEKGDYCEYVTSYDYTDLEKRVVWGVPTDTNVARIDGNGQMILEEENKLGFIPYVVSQWGNSLSSATNEQVMPLLQSIYDSGQWDMLNVLASIDSSLTLKRAAMPQYAGEYPPGQDPEIDNTEPSGNLKLPPGTRNFTTLPPQTYDQRVAGQKLDLRSGIWQSSVAKILQSLEFPSGTAFSSVNQVLTQATNSLAPYKILSESAISELAHQMLCWLKYYGKEYGEATLYGQSDKRDNLGEEISIKADTIDPDVLQIEVKLTPDIPVDRLQQINGAILLKQNFRIPEEELLEPLGYGDTQALRKRRDIDDHKDAMVQANLQRIQMAPQLEVQQMQMAQQQEMASQQMAQEQEARMQEQAQADAANGGTPAQENMGGLGMNPAAGGMPPVQMARGQA